LSALAIKDFDFFPPPQRASWQYRVFWILFRMMFAALLALSIFEFNPAPFVNHWTRYALGLPILVLGFGCATYFSARLGWANSHWEKDQLVVSGVYRYIRNPIYVASIVGMFGWAVFVNSISVSIVLALWALMYLLAPLLEERWLERSYGVEYLAYNESSSRYFGRQK
jgi:protein-S-isoprenylcysteine O-methyltransferase Ste14